MKPGAILATNTSTLDLDAIAGFTKRPEDVIGLHFFSPAPAMKLLEVVRGAKSTDTRARHRHSPSRVKLKKEAVVSGSATASSGTASSTTTAPGRFMLDEGAA